MIRALRGALAVSLAAWGLAMTVPAMAAVPDTCVYDATAETATVTFPDEPDSARTISREAGGRRILYQGAPCGAATVGNTRTIVVHGGLGAQILTIDQHDGRFRRAPGRQDIRFDLDLGAGTDTLAVTGTRRPDWMFFSDDGVRLGTFVDERIDILVAGVDMFFGTGARATTRSASGACPRSPEGKGGTIGWSEAVSPTSWKADRARTTSSGVMIGTCW